MRWWIVVVGLAWASPGAADCGCPDQVLALGQPEVVLVDGDADAALPVWESGSLRADADGVVYSLTSADAQLTLEAR